MTFSPKLPEWSIHYLVYQAFSGRKWLFLLNFETIFSFAGNFPYIFLRTRSTEIANSTHTAEIDERQAEIVTQKAQIGRLQADIENLC